MKRVTLTCILNAPTRSTAVLAEEKNEDLRKKAETNERNFGQSVRLTLCSGELSVCDYAVF